eukprot:SAG11_NODE_2394_length_3407_cov_1.720677_4_plen_87_part_00
MHGYPHVWSQRADDSHAGQNVSSHVIAPDEIRFTHMSLWSEGQASLTSALERMASVLIEHVAESCKSLASATSSDISDWSRWMQRW